jgi:hypothetical protein
VLSAVTSGVKALLSAVSPNLEAAFSAGTTEVVVVLLAVFPGYGGSIVCCNSLCGGLFFCCIHLEVEIVFLLYRLDRKPLFLLFLQGVEVKYSAVSLMWRLYFLLYPPDVLAELTDCCPPSGDGTIFSGLIQSHNSIMHCKEL